MIIELLDGTRFDIAVYNLRRLYHYVPSAEIEHTFSSVDGKGETITNTTIKNRTISVELMYKSYDIYDFYLLRDEVNALFTREESFYIIFKREGYKRYKVKLANNFTIPPHSHVGKFTIDFVMVNRYAESVGTTSDLKQWDVDKWGWNNSISWDDEFNYTFNSNSFIVKNLGNSVIDPRESELEITLKGDFNSDLTILNQTTGDLFRFNKPLIPSDTLTLSGVRTFKNGQTAFKDTNKKLIKLATGENRIIISGSGTKAIVNSVTFNFRFLYK